jgi:hypothetical protein
MKAAGLDMDGLWFSPQNMRCPSAEQCYLYGVLKIDDFRYQILVISFVQR